MKYSFRLPPLAWTVLLLAGTACSTYKPEPDPYAESWNAALLRNEWTANEAPSVPSVSKGHYFALPQLADTDWRQVDPGFVERYPKWVSRAYYRLISEAFQSDRRVKAAYQESYFQAHRPENSDNRQVQADYETARRRFVAHTQMLNGLLSWKSFNPKGSDDLEFFMREQFEPTLALYERGVQDQRILDHLMTELADLYHKREEGMPVFSF